MKEVKLSKGSFRNYIRNTLIPSLVPNRLKEKKIGFNKGAEYDEEAADEFDDFAVEVGQLYQIMKDKTFRAQGDTKQDDVDAIAQQILTLIDNDTEGDLRTQFKELSQLINSLPDKPTETPKIGFRQAANELYMYNKTNKNG